MKLCLRSLLPVVTLVLAKIVIPDAATAAPAPTESSQSALITATIVDVPTDTSLQPGIEASHILVRVDEVLEGSVSGSILSVRVTDPHIIEGLSEGAKVGLSLGESSDGSFELFALASTLAAQEASSPRGYQSRACGFDLNFNGVIGEPADCNVCDGTTTDVDGNGVQDDLRYVDCDSGTNSGSCTAGSPCRTAQYALDNIGVPGANQIQAVCIRGTCESAAERTMTNRQSGASGFQTRSARGSEEWAFQYPRYPLIISGWDSDNDGRYPPFDADDTAVFDGNASGNQILWFDNANESRVEVAHLTVRDYLRSCSDGSALIPQNGGGPDHLYFHDWNAPGNGQGCGDGRWISAFEANGIRYHAFENLNFTDFGGFIFYRGNATEGTGAQYIRFKNITMVGNGGLDSMTKFWNNWNNIEWLDTWLSGDIERGLILGQCTQDWVIRNNRIEDAGIGINLQVAEVTTCNSPGRPMDDVVIDRNEIRCDTAACRGNYVEAIIIGEEDSGGTNNEYWGDITITNNFLSVAGGSKHRGILIDHPMRGSGTNGGAMTIVGNTFDGNFTDGAIVVQNFAGSGSRVASQWVVRNNLFSTGNVVDSTSSTLSNYSSTGNRWEAGMSTDQVQGASCSQGPSYVNASAGDFHLQAGDTCAIGAANDPSGGFTLCPSCVDFDFDGETRPLGTNWDAGADSPGTGGSNSRPSVTVSAPQDGAQYFEGASINFAGTASDLEDGNVTSQISWSSNLDGSIGSGGSFSTVLSLGTHSVTASVTDSGGLTDSKVVNVTVNGSPSNTAPTVTITSPEENPALGKPVTSNVAGFSGAEAENFVDGRLDAPDSAWAAPGTPAWIEVDLGQLRTLNRIEVSPFFGFPGSVYYYDDAWKVEYDDGSGTLRNFSNVSLLRGAGTVTGSGISVTDGDPGVNSSVDDYKFYEFAFEPLAIRRLRFTVTDGDLDGDSNGAELVVGEVFPSGQPVTLAADANDTEDGDLSSTITWTSSRDGYLGGGGTLIRNDFSVGVHTISARVADSHGVSRSDTLTLEVVASPNLLFNDGFEVGYLDAWSSFL